MIDFRDKNIKIDPKYLKRDPNEEYIASISYGKDSLAMLEVIKNYGLPLDRIITIEVWATETIYGELPEIIEFKKKVDKIIKERYGIEVEHLSADLTFEQQFYKLRFNKNLNKECIYGFPITFGAWCNDRLKMQVLKKHKTKGIHYIGIAYDEPDRFHNLNDRVRAPLVEIKCIEEECYEWCKENDLLSPVYTQSNRSGCWFCPKQPTEQLRYLRKNYPELWSYMLKWDKDSPVPFKPNGKTVHDYDRRFEAEELGLVPMNRKFRWKMLDKTEKDLINS